VNVGSWHGSDVRGGGRAIPLCPSKSDSQPVGYGESVVDLDTRIAHRAVYVIELDCLRASGWTIASGTRCSKDYHSCFADRATGTPPFTGM
jgi:hypothetical protein